MKNSTLLSYEKKLSKKLKINNLLLHFPIKYEDKTKFHFFNEIKNKKVIFTYGKIVRVINTKKILICSILRDNLIFLIKFFYFTKNMIKNLLLGKWITVYGTINIFNNKKYEICQPKYEIFNSFNNIKLSKTLTPVYPLIKGYNQNIIRKIVLNYLKMFNKNMLNKELLPSRIYKNFMTFKESINIIHNPKKKEINKILLAKRSLILEKAICYYLTKEKRNRSLNRVKTYSVNLKKFFSKELLKLLPYKLTKSQIKALKKINKDIKNSKPMLRLLQGDVGSGKTIISMLVSFNMIKNGYQVILMVPTELLAKQHFNFFNFWFKKFKIKTCLFISKQNKNLKNILFKDILLNKIKMIIGTHAVLNRNLKTPFLGLAIIDEQHKFGVSQRSMLFNKQTNTKIIHKLIITATPIPRTLANTFYKNFKVSYIKPLPNKKNIKTSIIKDIHRSKIIENLIKLCIKKNKQAFWVCPLIENKQNSKNLVTTEFIKKEFIKKNKSIKVEIMHSKLKRERKKKIVDMFINNSISILITTTVIEVGIDIKNAKVIVIDNSERFGLSQLHQLRGRVGRNNEKCYCILLYSYKKIKKKAINRLKIIKKYKNGIEISKKDLENRGPGDIFGIKQSGNTFDKDLILKNNYNFLTQAKKIAKYLHENNKKNCKEIINRWK
ncbi:MAG: DEAD/DEAH box helicase [Enterobacteriaceae bacterium]